MSCTYAVLTKGVLSISKLNYILIFLVADMISIRYDINSFHFIQI